MFLNMSLSVLTCLLVLQTLWPTNNALTVQSTLETSFENSLQNILTNDGNLFVSLDLHDEDYNWVNLYTPINVNADELDQISFKEPEVKGATDKELETTMVNTESDNRAPNKVVATPTSATGTCDPGIKGLKWLFVNCKFRMKSFSVLGAGIWRDALIWLAVYSLVAIPFWCVKGWCCCCLRCKFFKPQETIQEAKDYLLLNPPGVLVTKKGAIIHYEPTEREKHCYEEFGHFMRTL